MQIQSFIQRTAAWAPLLYALCAGLMVWRILTGAIFLPLDLVPHFHPWRYSYDRSLVNNENNSDIVLQVYPRRVVANQAIKAGELPLWDPTILTGTPLLADGQLGFFYPPGWLFVILPVGLAFGVYAWLHLVLAGWGSFLFLRRMNLSSGAAWWGGLAYMLSGFGLTWLQFPEFSAGIALLPWCFWAVERAYQRSHGLSWLGASVVLALPLLVQIQLAFYTYVAVGLLILWHMYEVPDWRRRVQLIGAFTAAILVAVLISAAQLFPQIALSSQGQRPEAAGSVTATSEFQFTTLLRLFFPGIESKPRTAEPPWGYAQLLIPQPYIGLLTLGLSLVALVLGRKRHVFFFTLLAIGAFCLAIATPLLNLLIATFPPYRQFTDHQRWFMIWGFAAAVVASYGIERIIHPAKSPAAVSVWNWLNKALIGSIAGGILLWTWLHLDLWTPTSRYGLYSTHIRQQPIGMFVLLLGLSCIAITLLWIRRIPVAARISLLSIVLILDVMWYAGSYNTLTEQAVFNPTTDLIAGLETLDYQATDRLYPPVRQLAFLQQQSGPFRIFGAEYGVWPPNIASTFGLEDIRGYKSLYLARYNRLARLIDGEDPEQLGSGVASFRAYITAAYTQRELLDMLNVEYLLFPPGSTAPAAYQPLELVYQDDEGTIYRNPTVLPRAWMVYQTEVITAEQQQLQRLIDPAFDPAAQAFTDQPLPTTDTPNEELTNPIVTYNPNQVQIDLQTATPGLLVLADAYDDGWQATLNGQPTLLYRTNYALRGVWVPAGEHSITMSYRPVALMWGIVISLITLSGISLILVLYKIGKNTFNRNPTKN